MKTDIKKFDDVDIYISGNTTPEETKAFSEFLKAYKAKQARNMKARLTMLPSKNTKVLAK